MYNNLKQTPNDKQFQLVCDIGILFFYNTIDNYSDSLILFPSSNELCTQVLANLGVSDMKYCIHIFFHFM